MIEFEFGIVGFFCVFCVFERVGFWGYLVGLCGFCVYVDVCFFRNL